MLFNSPYKFAPPLFGPNTPVSGRIDENELLTRSNNWQRMASRAKHFDRNLSIPGAIKATMVAYCGHLTPVGGTSESRRVFIEWAEHADYQTSSKSLWEINSELVAVLTWADCLVTMPTDPYAAPNQIAARIKLVDPLQVESPPMYRDGKYHNGIRVVLGVALEKHDIEIGYYIRKGGHTGDSDDDYTYIPRVDPTTGRFVSQLIRRPGSTFPGQLRSFPMTANCMNQINDLEKLCESAVHAGINKNLLALMLKTSDPSNIRQTTSNVGDDGKLIRRQTPRGPVQVGYITPGSISMLPPDTDPVVISHAGNTDLVASIKMNLQMIAASVRIPYEVLLSSFLGISFSGGKLSYDSLFRLVYLWNTSIASTWKQIYRWVLIEHYLINGIIPTEQDLACNWIGPAMPDPDPEKSAKANALNIANGLDTRSAIVARRGIDYGQHLQQIKSEENLEMKELGYRLGDTKESASHPQMDDPQQPEDVDATLEAMPL